MVRSSAGSGWQNKTTSSAKREMLEAAYLVVSQLMTPLQRACWSRVLRVSMTMANSIGEMGSP